MHGVVCGSLTALAFGLVFGALDEYQVADYADQDPTIGLAGGLVAAVLAATVIAVVCRLRRRSYAHVLAPIVLLPPVLGTFVLGAERNRLEAALLWGTTAIVVHVLIGAGGRRALAGLVVTSGLAGTLSWGLQERWRAQKFEAVGLPTYVPVVPGYRLTGTYAGRSHLIERLDDDRGSGIDVWIGRDRDGCPAAGGRRAVPASGGTPAGLEFCLPDGAAMVLRPAYGSAAVEHLLSAVTVRAVDGGALARCPDGNTQREAD